MQIERGKVVTFHYAVKDSNGREIESSKGRDPVVYLHGRGSIVPGLENEMRGKKAGDSFTATIAPEHAYGMHDPNGMRRVPIKYLIKPGKLVPGKIVVVKAKTGSTRAIVMKAGRFHADLDFNHPLAGKTLVFDVDVLDVRDATAEETAHGHAHGPGGVEHGPRPAPAQGELK